MSPTETILSHLPQVAAWTDGAEAVDPRLRTGAQDTSGALDVPFATELAAWFRGEGWPVRVTVVPERGDRDWTLGRAVTLADRELRTDRNTSVVSHDPPETVPPADAHDLALDAGGLTAAEVMDRVAARLGIRDDPRPERLGALPVPLAAVLVGVDRAAEPAALLGLLDRLARQGARLLLVFRREGERAEHATELLVNRPLRERWARLHGELDRIVEELGPALDRLRDRVLPGPGDRRLVEQAEGGLRRTRMLRAWVAHTPDHEHEPARAGLLFVFEDAAERRRSAPGTGHRPPRHPPPPPRGTPRPGQRRVAPVPPPRRRGGTGRPAGAGRLRHGGHVGCAGNARRPGGVRRPRHGGVPALRARALRAAAHAVRRRARRGGRRALHRLLLGAHVREPRRDRGHPAPAAGRLPPRGPGPRKPGGGAGRPGRGAGRFRCGHSGAGAR
ncbi:hypothetical protein ACQ4WX_37290 [Streptomyces lasalocidi]